MTFSIQNQGKVGHPEFSLFGFSLSALLTEVRNGFPELASQKIEIWLRNQPTLATVRLDDNKVVIELHAVLNHSQTPERVVRFILRHELLHVLIRPREIDGRLAAHPPEFWDAERRFPDRLLAWSWVKLTLGSCLRPNQTKECTFVTRKWKALINVDRPSIEQIERFNSDKPQSDIVESLL